MRRFATLILSLAASLLLASSSVLAVDHPLSPFDQMQKKDECLLFAKNCQDNVYATQQRINRLNEEIMRGTSVYTHEELNILRKKLDDAKKALEFLMIEGV